MTGPLSLLSYNTQDSLSRSATLRGELGPSALVIYQENSVQDSIMGTFSQLDFLPQN